MSRFVECMQTVGAISPTGLEEVLDKLKEHLQAEKSFIQMEFPYFIYKTSPVTGQRAPMDLNCVLTAEKKDEFKLRIMAEVPVQTLRITSVRWRGLKLKQTALYGLKNWRKWQMQGQARPCTAF